MLTLLGQIEYFFVEKVEAPASHLIDATLDVVDRLYAISNNEDRETWV